MLKKLGLVSKVDQAALSIYCAAWARWIEAEAKVTEMGLVVKSPNGYPIQNPYLSIANTAAKQIRTLLAEFGLSPKARKRLTQPDTAPPKPATPADDPGPRAPAMPAGGYTEEDWYGSPNAGNTKERQE